MTMHTEADGSQERTGFIRSIADRIRPGLGKSGARWAVRQQEAAVARMAAAHERTADGSSRFAELRQGAEVSVPETPPAATIPEGMVIGGFNLENGKTVFEPKDPAAKTMDDPTKEHEVAQLSAEQVKTMTPHGAYDLSGRYIPPVK